MLNIFIDESGIHKAVDNSTFALAYVKTEHSICRRQIS